MTSPGDPGSGPGQGRVGGRRLRVCLLGAFDVRTRNGGRIRFPTRKSEALFAYLAANRAQPQSRDWCVELLWGDVPRAQGRHSLRQSLRVIRLALGPAHAALGTLGDSVLLTATDVQVDTDCFVKLLHRATPETIRLACSLYRGDLLAGLVVGETTFTRWLTSERLAYRQRVIVALERRSADLLDAGKIDAGLEVVSRLLTLAPLSEKGRRTAMLLHAANGQYNTAFELYEEYARLLAERLGIPPDEKTQAVLRGLYLRRLPPGPG